jgi:hypothetical protein
MRGAALVAINSGIDVWPDLQLTRTEGATTLVLSPEDSARDMRLFK